MPLHRKTFLAKNQHLCLSITRISVTFRPVLKGIALNLARKVPLPPLPHPPLLPPSPPHPSQAAFNLPPEKSKKLKTG